MQLTFIFHSGFVLETGKRIIVFDYWIDPTHVMDRILAADKPLYVLSSHFHEDHFTPKILEWRQQKADVTYILSKDILRHRRTQREEADYWMGKGSTIRLADDFTVTASGSNDSGVSWIVEVEGQRVFHAGDLNNWYARFLSDDGNIPEKIISEEFGEVNPLAEEKRYLGELKEIARYVKAHPMPSGKDFDLVMFPVDGRIGNGYTRGARQFIDRFSVGLFVPMHFTASGFESASRMKEYTDEKEITFWSIKEKGEIIDIKTETI